jgi:hypothetical protein
MYIERQHTNSSDCEPSTDKKEIEDKTRSRDRATAQL